jgi:hypothetical protein
MEVAILLASKATLDLGAEKLFSLAQIEMNDAYHRTLCCTRREREMQGAIMSARRTRPPRPIQVRSWFAQLSLADNIASANAPLDVVDSSQIL